MAVLAVKRLGISRLASPATAATTTAWIRTRRALRRRNSMGSAGGLEGMASEPKGAGFRGSNPHVCACARRPCARVASLADREDDRRELRQHDERVAQILPGGHLRAL